MWSGVTVSTAICQRLHGVKRKLSHAMPLNISILLTNREHSQTVYSCLKQSVGSNITGLTTEELHVPSTDYKNTINLPAQVV